MTQLVCTRLVGFYVTYLRFYTTYHSYNNSKCRLAISISLLPSVLSNIINYISGFYFYRNFFTLLINVYFCNLKIVEDQKEDDEKVSIKTDVLVVLNLMSVVAYNLPGF